MGPVGWAHRAVSALIAVLVIVACTATSDPGESRTVPPTGPSAGPSTGLSTVAPAVSGPISATVPDVTVGATEVGSGCVDELSIRQLAALLVWPSVYPSQWDSARRAVESGIGGVLLMQADGLDADAVKARLDELDALSELGVVVAVDEEGGSVQRLRELDVLPSQQQVSERLTPERAGALVARHAQLVSSVGVDVVLGPVIDVLPADGARPPLQRSRFFSGPPEEVAEFAHAYVDAWRASGVLPVLKHYPGHGSASGDTHTVEGRTPSLADLEDWDLVPYRLLAGSAPAVMVGHLTVPGLTDGLPTSLSSAAIDHLRGPLGFGDALVVSDALDMAAVGLELPDAARAAIAAGVDVVLFTDTAATDAVIAAVEEAATSGVISLERLRRSGAKVLALGAGGQCG